MGRRRYREVRPKRPTVQMIREQSTGESFEAGRDCLDGVVPSGMDRGIARARVRDGETYDVTAFLGYGSGMHYCTCPHYGEDICRHIVAVLLYASKNFGRMNRDEEDGKETGDPFRGLSAAQLESFLAGEMAREDGLRRRFLSRFGRTGMRPNIRAEIDGAYYQMGDAGVYGAELNFGDYLGAAEASAGRGDLDDAVRIYREISEAIYDNMDNVDDSNAYYNTTLGIAVEKMAACIVRQNLDHSRKRRHISYLHGRMVMDDYGCDREYEDALRIVCTDEEDRAYLKGLGG